MFSKKNMIFIMLILILFTLSAASAADNSTTDVVGLEEADDEPISIEKTQIIEKTENDDVLKDGNNSFSDLEKLIESGKYKKSTTFDDDITVIKCEYLSRISIFV